MRKNQSKRKSKLRVKASSTRKLDAPPIIAAVGKLFLLVVIAGLVITWLHEGESINVVQMIEKVATLSITGLFALIAGRKLQ